jgi:ATP-binding cassette, subfamily B, multidrug efflux pump
MALLLRLGSFVKPYWKQVLFAFITLVLLTALSLLVPYIIAEVIDQGLVNKEVYIIAMAALALLGIGTAHAGLSYIQSYLTEWIATHVGYDLRNRLYNHIQHLPFTFHDHAETGQLISRCIEDVRSVERFAASGLVELVHMGLLLVAISTLLFIANPTLAAISLLPIIPLVIITTNFGKRIGGLFFDVDNFLGELSSRIQENVMGVQVIRAFAREDYENTRFNISNRRLFNARIKVINEWSKIMPTSQLLVTLSTILILWFGGQMVMAGTMTIGELVAFNSYLIMLATPAQQLTWLVNAAGEAVAGARRLFEVLDITPAIQSPQDPIQLPNISGEITFEQVSFGYHGEKITALEAIHFSAKPDQIVALIGPTGSGKTSLINLIPRFYDASQGGIFIDGHDIRQLDLISLRKQIGIVLQTSLLFSCSIRDNIAYGKPDASIEEVVSAAKAAQAHDFIMEFPDKYETIVGERGITLSGGQRQRVAIARALLLDPRILILDDSTSSVDTHTERQLQLALEESMKGRTTFVIAHRLSTVRRADLILVMDHGKIVESGKHTELIDRKGLYYQIYDLQLRNQDRLIEISEKPDLITSISQSSDSQTIESD